jgi:hypothetical protein
VKYVYLYFTESTVSTPCPRLSKQRSPSLGGSTRTCVVHRDSVLRLDLIIDLNSEDAKLRRCEVPDSRMPLSNISSGLVSRMGGAATKAWHTSQSDVQANFREDLSLKWLR